MDNDDQWRPVHLPPDNAPRAGLLTLHDLPALGGRWRVVELGGVFLAGQVNQEDTDIFQFRTDPAASFTTYDAAYLHCEWMNAHRSWLGLVDTDDPRRTFTAVAELAQRIADVWTGALSVHTQYAIIPHDARGHTALSLREMVPEMAHVAREWGFLMPMGQSMLGDIAGFRVGQELIALVPLAANQGYIVHTTRDPDSRDMLADNCALWFPDLFPEEAARDFR